MIAYEETIKPGLLSFQRNLPHPVVGYSEVVFDLNTEFHEPFKFREYSVLVFIDGVREFFGRRNRTAQPER